MNGRVMFGRSVKCLIGEGLHGQALPLLLARRTLVSSITKRKDCDTGTFMKDQKIRQSSGQTFNINDIIKANAKHKPGGKNVGTSTKKQLKKTAAKPKKVTGDATSKTGTTKANKLEAEIEKDDNVEMNSSETGIENTAEVSETENTEVEPKGKGTESEVKDTELGPVPSILKTVLEIPLIVSSDLDVDKLAEFKEFVEDLELKYLPSVSRIITATQSPEQTKVLERWQAKMIKELGGEEQFKEYKQGILDNGLNLHECIYNQLTGNPDATPLREGNQGHWESIAKVLPDVNDVVLMEKECVHPELFYKGKFDCIAKYRGTLCLIEWKTSSKPKPLLSDTYDNPLQIAAYLGAVNRTRMLKKQGVEQLTFGAIVIAYNDGEPATVHAMNQKQCERYWRLWTKRLYAYWVAQYDMKKVKAEGFG